MGILSLVGKGVAGATPSPLSQWSHFSIFARVHLSRNGAVPSVTSRDVILKRKGLG